MRLNKDLLVATNGHFEGPPHAVDEETAAKVANYKIEVCKNFISLNPNQGQTRIAGTEFFVTRKYDGEFNMLFFDGGDLIGINIGGKVRMDLPCMRDAAKALKAAGVQSAAIP